MIYVKGYIYHITNTVNNKRYIGQTINFQVRKNTHLRNLRDNKHYSLKLQRAWNKILNLKPATVKDWFNGRSRKKEKQEYLLLSTEQLEVLKNRGIKREP